LTASEDLIKIERNEIKITSFKGNVMKRIHKLSTLSLVFSLFIFSSYSIPESQPEIPETGLPVLITSCGQSPGPIMLKVVFMRLKLEAEPKAFEVIELATAEDLKAMEEAGTPYKSLIIVMGASLKGMGAAGISIDDELSRTSKLIEEARRQGITIIGAHIEGMKRRAQGAAVGDNTDELSIDAVAPKSDLLVIIKEGNTDGRFTTIANEKNIPMIEAEKTLDLLSEFKKLFQK
jgi:porphobilinogen deaminase